ncbi:unnamed protein product, partial [Ectocarpus fasciculatus]
VRPAAVPGFLPSPAATEYRHNNIGQLMDDRVKAGIAPDELLFLSNSARGMSIPGPRRDDLFSALRRRQDMVSGREKRRRRRAIESRRSEEVLAGMLFRTDRDSLACQAGHQQPNTSGCLALLRAGRPTLAVQQLHSSPEIGFGQALGLNGDDRSELESGISEWGSGDDSDTAAFEALLEKEARATRRHHDGSAHLSSSPASPPSACCSLGDTPRRSLQPKPKRCPVSVVRRARFGDTNTEPKARPALGSQNSAPVAIPEQMPTPLALPKEMALEDPVPETPPARVDPSADTKEYEQRGEATPRNIANTETRSEGVQCSGPPVDQGVQTSALRLPRKSGGVTHRTIHPRPLSPAKSSGSRSPEAQANQHGEETYTEESCRGLNTAAGGAHGSARVGIAVEREARMHVRVGLEGLRDADRGQQREIWSVANGGDANATGPVMMLPLEVDHDRQNDASVRSVRRFLKVTDFTEGPHEVGDRDTATSVQQSDHTTSPVRVRGGVDNGVVDPIHMDHRERQDSSAKNKADSRDESEGREQGRTGRLDPLWAGLGSLGERLAEVGGRFDQLDQEICHDREVIEGYQREAQEEAELAARDLLDIRTQRSLPPTRTTGSIPQVPLWRCRTATNLTLDTKSLRIETTSRSTKRSPLSTLGFKSCGSDDGGQKDFGSKDATLEADRELREARAILQSIEEELKPHVVTTTLVSPPRTTLCTEPALSTPCTKNACKKQPRPPRCREEEQAAERPAGRQQKWFARDSDGSRRSKQSRAQGRSVGTAVAHFPTAVAVAKSKARVRKATRRAWE